MSIMPCYTTPTTATEWHGTARHDDNWGSQRQSGDFAACWICAWRRKGGREEKEKKSWIFIRDPFGYFRLHDFLHMVIAFLFTSCGKITFVPSRILQGVAFSSIYS